MGWDKVVYFAFGLTVGILLMSSGGISTFAEFSGGSALATETPVTDASQTNPTETPQPSDINETRIEQLILKAVNIQRAENDMAKLQYSDVVSGAARSHADDMAVKNYFSHTSQDGETQSERYGWCDGGENIAQTWVGERIKKDDGSIVTYESNVDLAAGIVTQWMNSKGHRERGIFGDWIAAGVGVAITDEGKVYAVLGFCDAT